MDLIFPDEGLVEQLNRVLSATVNYHLFTAGIPVDLSTVLADLTEAAWAGYGGPIALNFTNFPVNGVTAHQGFATGTPITFGNTSGSDQTVLGYYVTDGANTMLMALAVFDAGPIIIPDGGTLLVVPVWGDFSQLSS